MELEKIIWNQENYSLFLQVLKKNQDEKYRDFNKRIAMTNYPMLGIRSPILQKIARQIVKGDYQGFIRENSHKTYEEILLHGLVLCYLKTDIMTIFELYDNYIPYIDCWALVDMTAHLKTLEKNLEQGLKYVYKKLESRNPWEVRVGILLLLTFYVTDTYIDTVLAIIPTIKKEDYYIKMANAWLVSLCFIKYREKTLPILLQNKLDIWTHNKSISKIHDSYRVDKDTKDYLNTIKR